MPFGLYGITDYDDDDLVAPARDDYFSGWLKGAYGGDMDWANAEEEKR